VFGQSRTSLVGLALAATLGLAACGDDSDDKSKPSAAAATTPAVTTPANTTTAAAPEPAPAGADVSEAGEELAIGTRVVAPYTVYGTTAASQSQKTTVGVTVKKVRRGKISDFKDFNLDKDQKSSVPYYVEVKYENLGDLKLNRSLLDPSIEDSDGQEYKPLNLIILSGTFKVCPKPASKRLLKGQSFTLCAPFLMPKGKDIERVRFHGDVTQDPYFWK
jgi:hypothetical protein